jgi:WD40 repeat protein
MLACASADHTVRVWDVGTGKLALTFPGHQHAVNSVAFSPDDARLFSAGDVLATGGEDLAVWAVDRGENRAGVG